MIKLKGMTVTYQGFDYKPYGDTLKTTTGTEAQFGFMGEERDIENRYIWYGARQYDKQLGRFLSADPLLEKFVNHSSYQYAFNSPMVWKDVSGLSPEKEKRKDKIQVDFIEFFSQIISFITEITQDKTNMLKNSNVAQKMTCVLYASNAVEEIENEAETEELVEENRDKNAGLEGNEDNERTGNDVPEAKDGGVSEYTFIDEDGNVIKDGGDPNCIIAVNQEMIDRSTNSDGEIDYNKLSDYGYKFPSVQARISISEDHHSSSFYDEGGGVGDFSSYTFGGRSENEKTANDESPHSGEQVLNAVNKLGDKNTAEYTVHDHPKNKDKEPGPSDGDYQSIHVINKEKGTNISYGILIEQNDRVYFYNGGGKETQVSVPSSSFLIK